MKNEILEPVYITNLDKIKQSDIGSSNIHNSKIAGFNWRNIDFPYMHTHALGNTYYVKRKGATYN